MQHLEFSGTVRPLKWSLGVKWLRISGAILQLRLRICAFHGVRRND